MMRKRRKRPVWKPASATPVLQGTSEADVKSPVRRRIIVRGNEPSTESRQPSLVELRYNEFVSRVDNSACRATHGRLRLLGRSIRLDVSGECSRCHVFRKPLWFYSKTTGGPRMLCSACKARLLAARAKKSDALDHADFGGAFEMNRRRH
jgi:hypothetical protein